MTTRGGVRWLALAAAVVAVAAVGSFGRAEGIPSGKKDSDLRRKVLELNDITGTDPLNGKLRAMLADSAGTLQLLKAAARVVKEKEQPLTRNTTLLLARAAENAREVDISAALYRVNIQQNLALRSETGLANGYLGLLQLYSDNRRNAEVEKLCKEFLSIETDEEEGPVERYKPIVEQELVLAIARQGSTDKALELVDKMIEANPRNFLVRALKGRILREAEKYDEAAKTYLDVIDRLKNDGRLDKDVKTRYTDMYRYLLSGVYVDLNQIDKAAEQLKALLAEKPNNPTYNNDLGFIWADRGMNLAESEKLIRKAIEEDRKLRKKADPGFKPGLESDNAAYLDSLGWVLFKQGKAKEARPLLLQSVKDRESQSIEIWDHLADVHMALGEKAEAVAAWKKGLEAATPSKRDQKRKAEVQKKLKEATSEKQKEPGKEKEEGK